ncbi:hypothetical protein ASD54_12575 [Rhizobium sp. Root149]|uniref:hypothetical protein n=1 Tax=Rhizobium sp. Root149 TaxID=1736473 RepID=UPI0007143990|nr:hypothetical protein [Rhizobium sp. Root149]KQZ49765.1 hypothetical protein ASD54_12575 [Rhizobium sp. Root149]
MKTDNREVIAEMTTTDGKRVRLTPEQASSLLAACEQAQQERMARLPDTASCLSALCDADSRMRELGWRNGRYCPRDGSPFAVCQVGSTGMWAGHWSEDGDKRPFATGYVIAADCVHRPSEVYFKPIDQLTDEERSLMTKCDREVAGYIERLGATFDALQVSPTNGSEK